MKFETIDHIVLSVTDLKKSVKFYETFLGKSARSKWDASWKIGKTKLFLTFPYKEHARKFDKHNIGLNHIALHVSSLAKLKNILALLAKAKIRNSGIMSDRYGSNPMIWLDDPDGIRIEFYLRK